MRKRWLTGVFTLAAMLGMFLTFVPTAAAAVATIYPILDGVTINSNGTVTASFGYTSDDASSLTLFVGSTNYFSPIDADQGQPTLYKLGSFSNVEQITWDPAQVPQITWNLLGQSVTAVAPSATALSLSPTQTTVSAGKSVTIEGHARLGTTGVGADAQIDLSASAGTLTNTSVVADSDGNFSTTFTAPSTAGPIAIEAQTEGQPSVSTTTLVDVQVSAPPVATQLSITSASSSVPEGQNMTVSGTVMNGASAASNVPVNVSATAGTLSQSTVTTDSNGQFQVQLTAPAAPGSVAVTASVPGANVVGSTSFRVLGPPQIITTALPNATASRPYEEALQASGLDGADVWSIVSEELPAGLTLSPSGVISGTPEGTATSQFTVQVASSVYSALKATQQLSLTVVPAVPSGGNVAPDITTATLPNGTVGQPYSESLQANGLAQGDAWNLESGSLPQGLALSSSGIISGVPSAVGDNSFAVTVTSSVYGTSDPQPLSINIQSAPPSGGITIVRGGGGHTIVPPPANVTYTTKTLATQSMSPTGGSLVYHGGDVSYQVVAPSGTFSQGGVVTLNTPSADVIQAVQSQLTQGTASLLYFGVQSSGQRPSVPMSMTVIDSNIPSDAKVYAVASNGTLVPVNAEVTQGQIQMPVTSTTNFVVTAPVSSVKPVIIRSDQRIVEWQGQTTIVPALVRNSTMYMPIWYVMQLLKSIGIENTWNGHDWNMTTLTTPDLSNIQVGTGNTNIYLNGTLVQRVSTGVQVDPSTKKPTSYMPIWYVEQILNRVGLHSTWDGTTWTVSRPNS